MIVIMSGQQMMQITQDNLLEKIDSLFDYGYCTTVLTKTVRAVVILHKEKIDMNGYGACEECSRTAYFNVPWPCETIKDIARELND